MSTVADFPRRYRLSLLLNLMFAACLIAIVIHEQYIYRIYNRISPSIPLPANPESSLTYKEQVDFYSIYTQQSDIVMLGNSLTHKILWNELLGRPDVANRGIGGDLTAGMLHRMSYVLDQNPKICFIEGGINDLDAGISIDTIYHNLQKIVTILQAKNIIPVLTTVTYVTAIYPGHYAMNASITRLNEKIYQLIKTNDLQVVDLNLWISKNSELIPIYARDDGNHLTSKAYLVWKKEILRILKLYGI